MSGSYDIGLIAFSILIAILASYTALSLCSRMRTASSGARATWLAAAAFALGGGIWSMHFVAVLAFNIPGMTMSYDVLETLGSLVLAVGLTAAGFAIVDWRNVTRQQTVLSGILIGIGVASMHYLGMAGLHTAATISYDPLWVAVSIAIAIAAAIASVWLAAHVRRGPHRFGAAVAMGAAISGMHYTGMYAASFAAAPARQALVGLGSVDQAYLGGAIAVVTLLVLVFALGAARLESWYAGAAGREANLRFLGSLNDRLLRQFSASNAMTVAAEMLGQHLAATRCAYADVDADGDRFLILSDYTAPGQATSAGDYSLDLFGPRAAAELRAGQTLVIRNVASELEPGAGREMFHAIAIDAIICCPLIKDGRLAAMMAVHQDRPRDWSGDEIALVTEVVDRCWSHVQRIGAEARLREQEERLRLAVDNADLGFWDVDLVHDTLIWPARTKAMFGISPDVPCTMQDFYDGLHPDDREATTRAFLASADPAERALYDVEYRTVGKEDGVIRWVAAKGRGVFDAAGTCLRVAGTVVEITARKAAEEALRELNATLEARIATAVREREEAQEALRHSQKMEAMGQLTGGVAHDFNNLLTPILGSLDLLQRKQLGGEREQRLIAGAVQSAERARTLVQRLLAFARRQPLQPVAVDLATLTSGMIELVASTIGPQIQLIVSVPDGLPFAKADPNQLEMAILNLAVNARDAMPAGGSLRIGATSETVGRKHRTGLRPARYLCLSVADDGIGMDRETLERAVEPFFSTKGVGKGTGLGLSMVHGLASQLGGAVTIESAVGKGTTVRLWLPESDTGPVAAAAGGPVSLTATGRALVVDDEDLVRISTADMLADLGYSVVEATSGEDALEKLATGGRFDLLVTDHLMPGMTGTQLARNVQGLDPHIRLLIVSGYAEAAGIDPDLPTLSKPFRKDELAACLEKVAAPEPRGVEQSKDLVGATGFEPATPTPPV